MFILIFFGTLKINVKSLNYNDILKLTKILQAKIIIKLRGS